MLWPRLGYTSLPSIHCCMLCAAVWNKYCFSSLLERFFVHSFLSNSLTYCNRVSVPSTLSVRANIKQCLMYHKYSRLLRATRNLVLLEILLRFMITVRKETSLACLNMYECNCIIVCIAIILAHRCMYHVNRAAAYTSHSCCCYSLVHTPFCWPSFFTHCDYSCFLLFSFV